MEFKPGVKIQGLQPEILIAMIVCNDLFKDLNLPFVVTSGREGTHMDGSFHYKGLAIDVRSRQLTAAVKPADMVKLIKSKLTSEYDVILESDHIHIEFDPKTPING